MSPPAWLRELDSPHAVRTRCNNVLSAALSAQGVPHFQVELALLPQAAARVAETTRRRYPTLQVPPHSRFGHFDAGGVPRLRALEQELSSRPPLEQARALVDVVITSVLLDAGAGMQWRYREPDTSCELGRSEGLAVASLAWLRTGGLSSRGQPYHVDAEGLSRVSDADLARAFQVSEHNPLVGVSGRVHLLRALGDTLRARSDMFGSEARLGSLLDHLLRHAQADELPAPVILHSVLDGLGRIWPGRIKLEGHTLGDVWPHPAAGGEGIARGLVPFHKLSQWLSYSLIQAVERAGLRVSQLDALTGLAEYRNGGLFLDSGVLVPKQPALLREAHAVSAEPVVEWRALTVALLDRLLPLVRQELSLPELPLAAMLEGGSWAAGRELAQELRTDGGPPLRVISDGTVF